MTKRNKKARRSFKNTSVARRRSKSVYGTSFEALEDRRLLAAITVGTAVDLVDGDTSSIASLIASPGSDGAVSLREALAAADNTTGSDTITFDANTFDGEAADVIRLQDRITVSDSTVIDAGELGVVVSGDSLGNDILVASSFIADVEASTLAGTFDDNTDGVFVFAGGAVQNVTISGLTITSGDSTNTGGGVLVSNFANLTINQSSVAGNRAVNSGGGIQSNTGSLTVDQSTISGNVADGEVSEGGGIHASGGSLALTNSTISGNSAISPSSATSAGGGLFTEFQTASIVNSTFTENTAAVGGGIASNSVSFGVSSLILSNSIVAGNSASISGPDLVASFFSSVDASFSLIGDSSGSPLTGSSSGIADINGNLIGTADNVLAPQLEELADNGGSTLTHALLAASPANNIGNTDIAFDQRGVARLIGGGSDIGAFEQEAVFIVVDNSDDVSDGDFSTGNLTLREAIDLSSATPEIEIIIFDANVFDGEQQDVIHLDDTLLISDSVKIDGGDLGVVISGDRDANDALVDGTFITDRGNNFNDFDNVRVFEINGSDQSVVAFSGLTITGGFSGFQSNGGGILSRGGSLVIENSILSGNVADNGSGGGIFAEAGDVTVVSSSISSNVASDFSYIAGNGGGIGTDTADVTITNSSISDNFASNYGGGVDSVSGNITVVNSTISGNNARSSGGGISSLSGNLVVTRSTISGNNADRGAGGGVVTSTGAVTISSSTISGNASDREGSAVQTIEGAVTITDSTITQNESDGFSDGAAVWISNRYDGNALASLTVRNSIIAGNNNDPDLTLNREVRVDVTSSLIGTNVNTSLSEAPVGSPDANGNLIGDGYDSIDPMLADLADNGGPTQTHALLATSPAIDAGQSLATTDQRGEQRPFQQPTLPNASGSNGSDIGAFEFQALVLTVDSSIDLVDGDFSAGNLSLREALTLANASPGSDTISFAPEVFNGQASDVIRLQLGELEITEGVTINAGGSNVVVSADVLGNDIFDPVTFVTDIEASVLAETLADNSGRIFNITTATGEDVTIAGLTVTGGNAVGGGGGINVDSAQLDLVNTSVSGNFSTGNGGGVLSNQDLTITDSTVSGNRGTGTEGGGIRTLDGDVFLNDSNVTENTIDGSGGGISTASGDVTINNSVVSRNESSFQGGGISTDSGTVSLSSSDLSDNVTVSDNNGGGGGGIYAGGDVTVNQSTVIGNNTFGDFADGGAIASISGDVTVASSTFSGNSTFGDAAAGGAIATQFGSVNITLSTFSGNSTLGGEAAGGAIATNSGNVTTTSSTFSGNSTRGDEAIGGAIATNFGNITTSSSTLSGNSTSGDEAGGGAVATNSGSVSITSSTISNNSTALSVSSGTGGGGVFIADTLASPILTIQNSIIAGNNSGRGNDLMIDVTASLDVDFSLIGDNTGTFLAATTINTSGNLIGSNAAQIDPLLDTLLDNGGVTLTHALLAGSPAIDTGSSSITNDQRGAPFVRTNGSTSDIGAFETQSLNLLVDTDFDIVNGNFSSRNLSLREAIDLTNANPGEDSIRFSPNTFRNSTFDAIHLSLGELTITESVNIDAEELGVVVTGDRNRDDTNFSGTAITDLASNLDSRLDDNSGVFDITAAAGETIVLSGLTITGGIGSDGGGIRNQSADLIIEDSTIAGNRVFGDGGAIFNDSGSVTISNSTISGNETIGDNTSGGGIHSVSGEISLTNSTVSGNSATGIDAHGGGVSTSSGDVTLTSVTITQNSAAGEGGGVFVVGSTDSPSLTINNTIVAGNTGVGSPDLRFNSSIPFDIGFSLIGSNSGTSLSAAAVGSPDANGNLIGSSAAVIDPLLGDLADNAGPTLTHEPLAGSPVIDAGGNSTLANDQRDISILSRDDGGGVDIGAFERFEFLLVVDTSSDVDDGNYSSGNLSLREALVLSNTNPTTDTITFDASVFNQQAADVIRLQLGELSITDGVVIDAGKTGVIISGDTEGDDLLVAGSFITDTITSDALNTLDDNVRVINITAAAGESVSIAGVTITGGYAGSFNNGGGIKNEDANLVLTDVAVSGNRTTRHGGGIYTDDGALTLHNSYVTDNFSDSDGGGIYSADGGVALNDTQVNGNSTVSRGGGIYTAGDVLTLSNSFISDNRTDRSDGGGIYTNSADVTANNSAVNANIAGGSGDGGGIYTSGGDITFNDSSLNDNTASDDGGGVRTSSGDLTFNRSTISGNLSGENGGGIESFVGDIVLLNTTVSGNQSGALGGGIFQDLGRLTHLINSTISNNQSDGDGGGIYHDSSSSFDTLRIENSIVAGNVTVNGAGSDLFYDSGITSIVSFSLIGTNGGTPLQATNLSGNQIGTDDAPIDPLLGNLADNGGPTLTHALLGDSPAINAGGTTSIDVGVTDQRGEDRIFDDQIDIGAFEVGPVFLLGDVNQDDAVNFLDISPFISVVATSGFQDQADINRDGAVNFLDISPFITLLSSPSSGVTSANLRMAFPSFFSSPSELESNQLDAVTSEVSLPASDIAVAQLSVETSRKISDGISVELVEASSSPSFSSTDVAPVPSAPSGEEVSTPTLLAFVGGSLVQDLANSDDFRNEVTVWDNGSSTLRMSDEENESLVPQGISYDYVPQASSLFNASIEPANAMSSADLFDAQPELLDGLHDFELDEILEGLLV